MTLKKLSFFYFISLFLWATACTNTQKQFGQTELKRTGNQAKIEQKIADIRSVNSAIFDSATYLGNENIAIQYRLFQPRQKLGNVPLVVVFHGSGAIGNDNKSQLGLLAKLFAHPTIQQSYPAYVLVPQFSTRSSDYVLDSNRQTLASVARPCLKSVLQLVDSLPTYLDIDRKRIYVVGFSMGGSTVINALSQQPNVFAAGISIAGIPQFDQLSNLTKMPIWLIHGIEDTENTIQSDEQFYKELGKKGKIRFWKLQDTTHDNIFLMPFWVDKTLPQWLFQQQKR